MVAVAVSVVVSMMVSVSFPRMPPSLRVKVEKHAKEEGAK